MCPVGPDDGGCELAMRSIQANLASTRFLTNASDQAMFRLCNYMLKHDLTAGHAVYLLRGRGTAISVVHHCSFYDGA